MLSKFRPVGSATARTEWDALQDQPTSNPTCPYEVSGDVASRFHATERLCQNEVWLIPKRRVVRKTRIPPSLEMTKGWPNTRCGKASRRFQSGTPAVVDAS